MCDRYRMSADEAVLATTFVSLYRTTTQRRPASYCGRLQASQLRPECPLQSGPDIVNAAERAAANQTAAARKLPVWKLLARRQQTAPERMTVVGQPGRGRERPTWIIWLGRLHEQRVATPIRPDERCRSATGQIRLSQNSRIWRACQ